jgi:hypothetical protein
MEMIINVKQASVYLCLYLVLLTFHASCQLLNNIAQDARGTSAMMGGVQVIFTGDFFQLPPVVKANETPKQMAPCSSQPTELTQDALTQSHPTASRVHTATVSREHRFCFQSDIWDDLFARRNCFVLNEVHRQKDESFSKLLNAIRWGDCSGIMNELRNVFMFLIDIVYSNHTLYSILDAVCDAFASCVGKELDSSDGILPTKIFTHR